MSDIVERLRGRADRYRQLWGNAAYYTEGDALFDEKTADTITTLRADLQKLNERNAEYIGTIDRLRRRVAETDVEIERLGKKLNVARYGEPDFAWSIYEAQMVDLRATNERLRAALEEIEQVALSYVHMKYAKLARAALEEEKPNG
jgi:chromosome segregation ATPase